MVAIIAKQRKDVNPYIVLYLALYDDIATQFGCFHTTECKRDRKKLQSRFACEGISFLTKSLPSYGKALDSALSSSTPLTIPGLARAPGTQLPKLFGWLLSRVFDLNGSVHHRSQFKVMDTHAAVAALRDLYYLFYKLELPYDTQIEANVVETFVRTENEITGIDTDDFTIDGILHEATRLVSRVASPFDHRDIIPGHGPGAVATGEDVFEKSIFKRHYQALERIYPFTEYNVLGCNQISDQLDQILSRDSEESGTARVVLVPKDSRGPRLISCEPLEYQWIQQGLGRKFQSYVELHPVLRGHVNFSNQEINRKLALQGSLPGSRWVTLDLKEASDRVSLELVVLLFAQCPMIEGLLACRSSSTRLPNGSVLAMKKFAPMGSALCFPVESVVFFALAYGVLRHVLGYDHRKAISSVYVYGDDLIVDKDTYLSLMLYFPKFGLMFNTGKCCVGGFFRESCGMDAFDGVCVTPMRIRTTWSSCTTRKADEYASYVAYRNAACKRHYSFLRKELEKLLLQRYGSTPYSKVDLDFKLSFNDKTKVHNFRDPRGLLFSHPDVDGNVNDSSRHKTRWNKDLNRLEVSAFVVIPKKETKRYKGWNECLRRLLKPELEPLIGRRAIPRRSRLVRGWIPVHH